MVKEDQQSYRRPYMMGKARGGEDIFTRSEFKMMEIGVGVIVLIGTFY